MLLKLLPDLVMVGECFNYTVFNLEGVMGPLTPFSIKWPLDKARAGHHLHYMNGEILGQALFSSEIE